jgi:hypothetical protein
MKLSNKIWAMALIGAAGFAACEKVADLPFYADGKPVVLSASASNVALKPADATVGVLTFNWSNPEYSIDSTRVKFLLQIDSAGKNFSNPVTTQINGARTATITGRELNNLLLRFGGSVTTVRGLDMRVVSSHANNNEQYISNAVKVTASGFSDSSVLTGSTSNVTLALNTAANKAITFNWTPSFSGYNGTVSYVMQYDSAGKNFSSPQEIALTAGAFAKDLTQGELNETALSEKVAGGTTGKLQYRIKATTNLGTIAYSNAWDVNIGTYVPILRFYMPGSYQAATGNGNNWDPGTAPELIRDVRPGLLNNMYYIYIFLPAGAEFKVTQGRSWDVNYGGTGGNLAPGGANFTVATAGVYRVSIDRVNLKYNISTGRMGFVGEATGANWDPGSTFPNFAAGLVGNNLFVGITDLKTGQWKLIDNNRWNDGSNTVSETRSYGAAGGPGSTMEVNGGNFQSVAAAGRYRVIWDGRNPDKIVYDMNSASEMRVVGDGLTGVNAWDPGASPQMTYVGNGVWRITLALTAGKDFKFLAGNAWGAFDYEDAGNGRIKWDGGPNFKTPATSGTYTITLNEHTGTYTITP